MAVKTRARLQELGIRALLTREDDSYIGLDGRISRSLATNAALFVSLHANEVRHRGPQGAAVYSYGRSRFRLPRLFRRRRLPSLPPPPLPERERSAALAQSLTSGLRGAGVPVEPASKAGYYVLKNPSLPSVLVELGYLSHPVEGPRLLEPRYQERLAAALAAGIAEFLGSGKPRNSGAQAR